MPKCTLFHETIIRAALSRLLGVVLCYLLKWWRRWHVLMSVDDNSLEGVVDKSQSHGVNSHRDVIKPPVSTSTLVSTVTRTSGRLNSSHYGPVGGSVV